MQERYIKSLEFDKILLMLANEAVCPEVKEKILHLTPLETKYDVRQALEETDKMLSLTFKFGTPRISGVKGSLQACERAVKGGVLSMAELLMVASALRNFKNLKEWFGQSDMELSVLDNMFYAISPQPQLEKNIYQSILSETEMADTASSTLYDIRQKIRRTESSIREKLDTMVKSQTTQKYLQESVVALRGGRFVVPVKSEHKSDVQGVIHDVSSTGSTLFVEPTAVVEANAKILQYRNIEQEEIRRILASFSSQIVSISSLFYQSYANMLEIDFVVAKSKLAILQNANKPSVEDGDSFSLIRARHPLIEKDKVVPVDISLGEEYDTMVVTGPNTGGKTVTLKTAGLLSTMAMHGLLIPADAQSKVCIFSNILVDIGDEQSIEQNLSTFSGHMKNITQIIKEAKKGTLVLLDELGAGTDPAEGAVLAVAIIEHLRATGAHIMATTHYGEMKIFALETVGVQNASCEFNVETLRPTYKISVGIPGKSNAFLISEKLGLPKEIINMAKVHLSQEDKRFDTVLSQLEDLKLELKDNKALIEDLKSSAETQLEKAKVKRDELIKQGQIELDAARQKAKDMANQVQTEAYALMDEMKILQKKENLSSQQIAQRAREIARKDSERLYLQTGSEQQEIVNHEPLKTATKGDKVFIVSLGKQAVVNFAQDRNGMVEVAMGMIKTKVHLSDLSKIVEVKTQAKKKFVPRPKDKNDSQTVHARTSQMEINLLGLNVDEAIIEVDGFIDNSLMSKLNILYLIHGKGTGALRKGLHEYLRRHQNVKSYRLGVYGEGEAGVTVVELK